MMSNDPKCHFGNIHFGFYAARKWPMSGLRRNE